MTHTTRCGPWVLAIALAVSPFLAAGVEEVVENPVDPIPEPSTIALFGIGALGLVWVRRRRTR